MTASPSLSRGIAVDAIEGLHLRRVRLVARLPLLVVAFGVGGSRTNKRRAGCSGCGTYAKCLQELTPADPTRLAFLLHRRTSLSSCSRTDAYDGSARASFSISTNRRPSIPTLR